jgi:hypothetical protein
VDTLLESPFCPTLFNCRKFKGSLCIQTCWGETPLSPPRIVVPISLTATSVHSHEHIQQLKRPLSVLPAIIDTGFNRTCAINYTHLIHKGVVQHEFTDLGFDETDSSGRKYFEVSLNIWLHKFKYISSVNPSNSMPEKFNESKSVRVYRTKDNNGHPWPSLPLLGLEFFEANDLLLGIDTKERYYSLLKYRSD